MNLSLEEENNKLEKNEIVPQIIKTLPKKQIMVKYGIRTIDMGDVLTPIAVKEKPTIEYMLLDDNEKDSYYTLILISADEPSKVNRSIEGEFIQWLIVNIKGKNFSKGDELVEYIQPLPVIGTGLHRYIFILCKQNSKLDFKGELRIPYTIEGRKDWSCKSFINKYKLEVVGVNYFESQYDDSVLETNEKLVSSKEKPKTI